MTKLSPRKYVGQMMGIWFLATSVGNLIAGLVGGNVDPEKLGADAALFTWTTIALCLGRRARAAGDSDPPMMRESRRVTQATR